MRQRVAVARGLAMEPRVLLLDEPFSALDALTRATLQDELAPHLGRAARRTVLLITNDVDEAILLADRIYSDRRRGPAARRSAPPIEVELPRPRARRAHEPRRRAYQRARRAIVDFLRACRRASAASPSAGGLCMRSGLT